MKNERLHDLLEKYFSHSCTDEERIELALLIRDADENVLSDEIKANWDNYTPQEKLNEEATDRILNLIQGTNNPVRSRFTLAGKKIFRYAAVIAMVVTVGIGLYKAGRPELTTKYAAIKPQKIKNDVAPGTNGAILTLSNGEKIQLGGTGHAGGLLATQNGSTVTLKNNEVIYNRSGDQPRTAAGYNTLTTPVGRTFKLQLPDGTAVWLNAQSSIQYPVVFNAGRREVTISGEVYFEVAKHLLPDGKNRQPFIVNIDNNSHTSNARVEVLGTHFNINAYPEEKIIRTTLIEGSVNVYPSKTATATGIKPGLQAQISLTDHTNEVKVTPVNINDVIAWKNGYFNFNEAGLATVMQELSRWYNVKIEYRNKVPERVFWGKMQRSLYLSQVLNALQQVDIHFTIENNTIIVYQ